MIDGSRRSTVKKQMAAAFFAMTAIFFLATSPMAEGPAVLPQPEAEAPGTNLGQCQELVALLAEQDQKNSREFRQIKRDIAALAQQVAEPGMREILGGVGYIFGLIGVAAYVASRKKVGGGGH
jgi:hypothetical protein